MSGNGNPFGDNEAVWLGGLVDRTLTGQTAIEVVDALEPGDDETVVEYNGGGQIDVIFEQTPGADDSILMDIKSGKTLTAITLQFGSEQEVPDIVGDNMIGIGGPAGRTVSTVFKQDDTLGTNIHVTARSGREVPMFLQRVTQRTKDGQTTPATLVDLVTAVKEGKVKLQDLPTSTRRVIEEKTKGKGPAL